MSELAIGRSWAAVEARKEEGEGGGQEGGGMPYIKEQGERVVGICAVPQGTGRANDREERGKED